MYYVLCGNVLSYVAMYYVAMYYVLCINVLMY